MKYNHNRPLSDFQDDIKKIESEGFKVIAVSQMMMEDTFVFETQDEADKAFKLFEQDNTTIVGWWYGKEDFIKAVEEYEKNNNGYSKVLIHWL